MSQKSLGRHLGGLTAAVLTGAMLTMAPLGVHADALPGDGSAKAQAGSGGGRLDPSAMARKAAGSLIAEKLPALRIGAHDGFVAQRVVRSEGISYVPYE